LGAAFFEAAFFDAAFFVAFLATVSSSKMRQTCDRPAAKLPG
jgi:hypothetical protein